MTIDYDNYRIQYDARELGLQGQLIHAPSRETLPHKLITELYPKIAPGPGRLAVWVEYLEVLRPPGSYRDHPTLPDPTTLDLQFPTLHPPDLFPQLEHAATQYNLTLQLTRALAYQPTGPGPSGPDHKIMRWDLDTRFFAPGLSSCLRLRTRKHLQDPTGDDLAPSNWTIQLELGTGGTLPSRTIPWEQWQRRLELFHQAIPIMQQWRGLMSEILR